MFNLQSLYATAIVVLATASFSMAQSNANCQSFGLNIVNGGIYFIDLNSQASFSFVGGFSFCFGTTTPILQFPSGVQYTCSTVNAADSQQESVCPVLHNALFAGQYTIFFPELGYARGFNIVNSQMTVSTTVTITATGTVTPVVTTTISITSTIPTTTTLATPTVTLPAATRGTLTITPVTTITTTSTIIRTKHTRTTLTTTSTSTKLPNPKCTTATPPMDVVKASPKAKPTPRIMRGVVRSSTVEARRLAKRDRPDGPLVTTITSYAAPTVILITAPASTFTTTSAIDATSTATVTPAPFTTFAGTVAATVTLSTKTATSTVRLSITSTVTTTHTQVHKAVITAALTAC